MEGIIYAERISACINTLFYSLGSLNKDVRRVERFGGTMKGVIDVRIWDI